MMKQLLAILMMLAIATAAIAAEGEPLSVQMPVPTVTVNTQTVSQIVAVWDKDEVPAGTFAKLSNLLKFHGIFCVRPDKGMASGGLAALASLATITVDAMQFDIGPAYVCGLAKNDEFFQGIEAAVATKFVGGKIQERLTEAFKDVPVLDLLPRYIDVSGFTAFVGAGSTLGGPGEWELTGFMFSIGGGGIKFGK